MPGRSHLFTPRTPGKAPPALGTLLPAPLPAPDQSRSQQRCNRPSDRQMPGDPGALPPSSPGDSRALSGRTGPASDPGSGKRSDLPLPPAQQLTSGSAGTPVRRRGPLDGPWESLWFCASDLCSLGEGDMAPLMGMDVHCGRGLRSRQTQCIFIVPAKSHVPQTSISNPIEQSLILVLNKNLKTPQLWIHFPIVLREEITLDGPEQVRPSWTGILGASRTSQESEGHQG